MYLYLSICICIFLHLYFRCVIIEVKHLSSDNGVVSIESPRALSPDGKNQIMDTIQLCSQFHIPSNTFHHRCWQYFKYQSWICISICWQGSHCVGSVLKNFISQEHEVPMAFYRRGPKKMRLGRVGYYAAASEWHQRQTFSYDAFRWRNIVQCALWKIL